MIEKCIVTNFKSLGRVELDLDSSPTLLLGGNNSGKSSLLEALHLAISAAQVLGARKTLSWVDDSMGDDLPLETLSSSRVDPRRISRLGSNSAATVELFSGGLHSRVTLEPRAHSIHVKIDGQYLGSQLMDNDQPFCVYVPGLSGITIREHARSEGVVRRAIARGDSNLVLRNVLALLHAQTSAWDAFLDDIRALFPHSEFEFDYARQFDDEVRVNFRQGECDFLPLDSAGTGVLQCIQLLAYMRLFRPRLLLLDEPDSHLHANNQRKLCDYIVESLNERSDTQTILATHSKYIVDSMQGRARCLCLARGELLPLTEIGVLTSLLDLGALDDSEKLAGRKVRCFVLTEDAKQGVIKPLLWAAGFIESETVVVSYNGSANENTMRVMTRMLKNVLPNGHIVIHRDRDYRDDAELSEFSTLAENVGATPFVTKHSDLEAYYIDADYLKEIGMSAEDANQLILVATSETRLISIKSLINERVRQARVKDPRSVNAGEIAVKAYQDYDSDPPKYRHGKDTLTRMKGRMPGIGHRPGTLFSGRNAPRIAALAAISKRIWTVESSAPEGIRSEEPSDLRHNS